MGPEFFKRKTKKGFHDIMRLDEALFERKKRYATRGRISQNCQKKEGTDLSG